MAEKVPPATGFTRNIPLQQRRQTTKCSSPSSSSRASSADHQPRPSGKSQTQSTREAAAGPTYSPKGKAPQRSSSSQSVSMDPYSGSSRSNSMGQQGAVVDPAEEITYTPTTNRISKAKKGKKVHVCEYGCGKVFTRAEHRKRHEANHRTEPLYTCRVEECRKPFQRLDLLSRHEERQHGIIQSGGSVRSQRYRTSSPASSIATSSQPNSPAATSAMTRASPSTSAGVTTPSAPAMSIGSIITPTTRGFAQQDQVWPGPYQDSFTTIPRGPYTPKLVYGLSVSDDSPLYSSDSNYSPISETPHAQPYLPQYGKPVTSSSAYPADYGMNMIASLSVTADFGPWPAHEESTPQIDGLGIGFEGQYPHPVGISILASKTHEYPVDILAESSTPTTLTFMERDEGNGVRAPKSFAAGLVASKNGLVTLDDETLQHYRDCYWKYFHPQFAVVHRPTMESGSFLDTVILAIGAQYSCRPHARSHSLSWFNYASRSFATLDPATITSESALDNLRVTILLEVLALYRWKSPGVYKSAHFAALYMSLLNDHARLSTDPVSYVQSLPANADRNLLQTAYTYWIGLETRRRVLLAAFVLDTQRSTLFQQPPCQTITPQTPNLPIACPESIWECSDLQIWFSFICQPSLNINDISPFTTNILQCLNIVAPSLCTPVQDPASHALLMAIYTPIHPLLTIAAESWLFARKVEDPTHWTAAKSRLRAWVESDAASQAVWHAGHYLRAHLKNNNDNPSVDALHTSWCLYLAALVCWAYGFSPTPHLRNQGLEATRYLTAVNVPSWKELKSMRGGGATREVLKSVRAVLGRGSGALVAEGESVLGRLIEGRGRLCWF